MGFYSHQKGTYISRSDLHNQYKFQEIESYWRTQKTFKIAQLFTWFPHLSDWNLTSLAGIQNEIFAAFNLIKSGNLRKLSLRRLRNVSIKGLVTCIEMATGEPASTFLRNVVELDIRGCLIPPCHIKMFDELFPNLQSIILSPDTIIAAKNRKLSTKSITEITHHVNISSEVKFTENENVLAADMNTVAFVREHLPDVRHIFIDLDS
ncbi:hypothetical protein CRE_11161 [Caenorhabditis remanei]|uniref:Uncharacterized protein n=1 Tax=Caenorhabditis remanei TaxID=31234 RepID=E3MQ30_CAERE|nr:hypothetical protein CRE_11161 [Caenorhabditis remanei]